MLSVLITIVVVLLVAALLAWAIKAAPNLDPVLKQYAIIIIYVGAGLYVLYAVVPLIRGLRLP